MASFHHFTFAKDVWSYISTFKNQIRVPPPTGYVLQLFVDSKRNIAMTASNLSNQLHLGHNKESLGVLRLSITRSVKRLNLYLKSLKQPNANEELFTFLSSPFPLPSTESQNIPDSDVRTQDFTNDEQFTNDLHLKEGTKGNCQNCSKLKLEYTEQVRSLKTKLSQVRHDLNNVCLFYKVKNVNQQIKRYTKQIADLRKKCNALTSKNRLLSSRLYNKSNLRTSYNKKEKSLKRRLSDAQDKIENSAEKARRLSEEVKELEWEVAQRKEDEFDENDIQSRIFCNNIRKCIYFCIISHVPVETTSQVINYITESQGKNIKYLPHPTTISRCSYELSILCDLQCAQFILDSDSLTLAWDATSIKGIHINQIVISSQKSLKTITTDVLPGGTSEDYADHLVSTIYNISKIYAQFSGQDALFIMNKMVKKFKCTLSDRASVNHCTVVRLMAKLDVCLLELNCQLHPLEAFASAAREALLEQEKASQSRHGQTYGQMAGAVNIIAAISKLRFKDGKGDPTGFKAFLKSQKIDSSLFPRYVGNCLHIVFHLGGSIFYLKDKLLIYLKMQCCQQKLRLALISDLSNELYIRQMQVLGLFGKIFTGPWMKEIYSSVNDRDHMGKTQKVLLSLDVLAKVKETPQHLFTTDEDAFGNKLNLDDIMLALRRHDGSPSILHSITLVASKVHARLERQLKKYREDPAYCPSDKSVQEATSSASVHNMVCERGLGMIDCFLRRAPNSSLKTIDAKVRGHLNGIMNWLEASKTQDKLLSFARRAGGIFRKETGKQRVQLEMKVMRRQQEKGQLREMAERRKKEKEVKKAIDEEDIEHLLGSVSGEQIAFVREILNGVTGRMFQHLWSTADGTDELYYGRIKKFGKAQKERKVKVAYWQGDDENFEDDAVDYQMNVHSLITDIILGDVFA